jgi:protein-S-isoprenylcysteine O-methyltransferase Ste14
MEVAGLLVGVVSLWFSFWAWRNAGGARVAAQGAERALLQRQTPWTLRELQDVAKILRRSLETPD